MRISKHINKFIAVLALFLLTSSSLYSGKSNKMQRLPKRTVTHVTLTCYQPLKSQCDDTPLITADGSKINLKHLKQGKIKWCAISRDLLWLFPKNKPKKVYIEGYGVYEIRDKMNARFEHRIDILIHPTDKTRFCEKNVKVTILD